MLHVVDFKLPSNLKHLLKEKDILLLFFSFISVMSCYLYNYFVMAGSRWYANSWYIDVRRRERSPVPRAEPAATHAPLDEENGTFVFSLRGLVCGL